MAAKNMVYNEIPKNVNSPKSWDEVQKEGKMEMLRKLQEKTLALFNRCEDQASKSEPGDSEEAKKIIGEIADELSRYMPDANVDLPIVNAYNSAVVLRENFSVYSSEMRGELRQIATLLNKAELQESDVIKERTQ